MITTQMGSVILERRTVAFATGVFITHFAYLLSVQLQNSALFNGPDTLSIIGHQYQAILASALVSILYIIFSISKFTKYIFYFLFAIIFIVYATSCVYFKITGQYFSMTSVEAFGFGDISSYWGSFVAEFGAADAGNYILALVACLILSYLDIRPDARRKRPLRIPVGSLATAILATTLFGVSFVTAADSKVAAITQYPLMSLFGSIAGTGLGERPLPVRTMTPQQFYRLKHGADSTNPKQQEILANNLQILGSRKRNVVMIIVESVGSKQLLENGRPRGEVVPFLLSQVSNSIIFDNLPTIYPASTYSHVALATGGHTPSWSSIGSTLLHPYTGQTVVSAFKDAGWNTALFSAAGLNFGSLNMFYGGLGYDELFDPDTLPDETIQKHATHSWGIDERVVADKALDWAKSRKEPFFLTFLTAVTHHPYGAPADFETPFAGTENIDKYKTSIRFTDSVIEKMVSDLKSSGLEKDTVLFIVGDHGEAFGDIHEGNFLHKSNLYEENINDYLMIIDLSEEIQPLTTHMRGTIGDVMPTMLDAQGIARTNDVVGQSLLSDTYSERIAYFQKSEEPQKWGLRDGKWKFIAEIYNPLKAELYDLDSDPDEKRNLIAQHPDWAAGYVERLASWYARTNDDFVARLRDFEYEGKMELAMADIAKPGPKRIAIGRKRGDLPFSELKPYINPDEDFVIWTSGSAFTKTTRIEYVFTSPSGKRTSTFFDHEKDWIEAWILAPSDSPREEGKWKVELFNAETKLIETSYILSSRAPLYWSAIDKTPGVREIDVGIKPKGDDFHILREINPRESVSLFIQSLPFDTDQRLDFLWIAPDDTFTAESFTQKAGWKNSWIYRDHDDGPMAPGTWRVEVWIDGDFKVGKDFRVSAEAPLFDPIVDIASDCTIIAACRNAGTSEASLSLH